MIVFLWIKGKVTVKDDIFHSNGTNIKLNWVIFCWDSFNRNEFLFLSPFISKNAYKNRMKTILLMPVFQLLSHFSGNAKRLPTIRK